MGSRHVELIEFVIERRSSSGKLCRGTYGVNVAKVREVVRLPKINEFSTKVPEVIGVFEHRGIPVSAINLATFLGEDIDINPLSQVLILEFNKRISGFVVHSTKKIRKVAWEKILPPSSDCLEGITGMTLIEGNEFMFILDFEMILASIEERGRAGRQPEVSIFHSSSRQISHAPLYSSNEKKNYCDGQAKILIVDDSATARKAVQGMLSAHYNIIEARNGLEALELLSAVDVEAVSKGVKLKDEICLIISDVEMPQMDGYTLTERIKTDQRFNQIPVIMHSSLSGRANEERGELAGCDRYVVKFNRKEMLDAIDQVLKPKNAA